MDKDVSAICNIPTIHLLMQMAPFDVLVHHNESYQRRQKFDMFCVYIVSDFKLLGYFDYISLIFMMILPSKKKVALMKVSVTVNHETNYPVK